MFERCLGFLTVVLILSFSSPTAFADTGSTSVELLVNGETVPGVAMLTIEDGTLVGKLGPIATVMGITAEEVTGCEDYVPVIPFLKTHGFEILTKRLGSERYQLRAHRDYRKEPYEYFIPEGRDAYWRTGRLLDIGMDVCIAYYPPDDFILSVNGRAVEAGLMVADNGRSYGRLGSMAEAIGYTDEGILACHEYVPITAFLASHGFSVEWVDEVSWHPWHPYVAAYRFPE